MTVKKATPAKKIERKTYDKEKTKQRLIDAVGKILTKEGFQNIKVNRIESVSKVSKKLIYRYFGNLDGLIKAYLQQKDFWNIELQKATPVAKKQLVPLQADEALEVLTSNLRFLESSPEMQKLVLWGVSEKNKTHREIAVNREKYGELLLKRADKVFDKTDIDFRAILVLLVSAAYYIVPHTQLLGTTMCGIDTTKKKEMQRITDAMQTIIELCYERAEKKEIVKKKDRYPGSKSR